MASSAPARLNAPGIALANLQTVKKGSPNAAKGIKNNALAQALEATAEAERRGISPSGLNVHIVGNKIVVGKIPNFTQKIKPARKWEILGHGKQRPLNNASSAPARLGTATASEQLQVGLPPLRIPMGAFPPQRAREPGTPTPKSEAVTEPTSAQSSNKQRRRKSRARKTRRRH